MKEDISKLVDEKIKNLNVYVFDAFVSTVLGKKILNIVLDSDDIIDLNIVTDASRIINDILDAEKVIIEDIDEVDIYSNEKGIDN